jgi:hypothetical protein
MPRRFYLLVTLATLTGAFLRLWQLTAIPPGLHYDLAATALLGNSVAFAGYRPIFIPAYTGHEALYYYWLALWFRLVGSSVFTLRLAAALLGILAIPAAFFALREALRFEEHSLTLAAFGAAFLSFVFFHVAFSRFGFRVISEPVIQSLALGFLFRGLHKLSSVDSPQSTVSQQRPDSGLWTVDLGHWTVDLGLSGFFTGLAAYTYLAARLFPVPLAAFWLALLIGAFVIRHSPAARPQLSFVISSFAIFSIAALITFAPLGLYFLQHPGDFLNRAGQVVPRPGETALLLEGIRRAAGMVFIKGETYDRFNLPGLPLFGPLLGFFFIVGLVVTLYRVIRSLFKVHSPRSEVNSPTSDLGLRTLRFATELMFLVWLPAMLLPTALSVHDIFPSNVRAFGLIPLLFIFPARGLVASYQWVQRRWPGPLMPFAYPLSLLCALAIGIGAYATYQDYFVTWASLPRQRMNNDADLTAVAGYLNAQDLSNTSVYVSAIHYRHPTLAYLAHDFNDLRWYTGGTSLVIPADRDALQVFARSAPPPDEWVAGWDAHLVAAPLGPDGIPDFRAYHFRAGADVPLPAFTEIDANFSNFAFLTGYRLLPDSDQVAVDLRWRLENVPAEQDIIPFARLFDEWGNAWAQSGLFTYPSAQWVPGDTLLTRLAVRLPAGLPPGKYTLKISLYSEETAQTLSVLDANGAYAGTRALLPELELRGGPETTPADFLAAYPGLTAPARVTGLAGDLTLAGYALNAASLRQGERLNLTLYWLARAPLNAASVQVKLGGRTLFAGQPVHDTFAFTEWGAGQVVVDRYTLKVPTDFAPGAAELMLEVPNYGTAALASVEIQKVERSFTTPEAAATAGFDFGHLITLPGYQLQPGATTTLTLFWQSLAETGTGYTVFVHLLDANGVVIAQADAAPRGGAYPTVLWVPGEFVSDPYTFQLPPGTYTPEIGVYLLESGARLPAFDPAGRPAGDAVRLPAFTVP